MTTKLRSRINPLNPLRITQFYPEQEVNWRKVESSMDRMLELQKIESVRRTMLMHEEMFKHQVQELHRLYSRQKKLMHELEIGKARRNDKTAQMGNASFTMLGHHQETETGNFFQAFSGRDDPREMSGSCSGESSRMPIKFEFGRPSEATTSSMCMINEQKDLSRIDEETDVEVDLTLSIGHCGRKKRPKSCSNTELKAFDLSAKLHEGEECGEHRSIVTSASVSLYQDDSQPHWLLKDLSLNKT